MTTPLGTRAVVARRLLPAAVALGLVLPLTASPGQAVQAATESAVGAGSTLFGSADSTGATCSETGQGGLQTTTVNPDGSLYRSRDRMTRTIFPAGRPSDSASFDMRASATAAVALSGGALKDFSFTGDVAVIGTVPSGHDCDFFASSLAYQSIDTTLRRGFLRLQASATRSADATAVLTGPDGNVVQVFLGTPGPLDYQLYVDGGDYSIDFDVVVDLRRPEAAGDPTQTAGGLRASGTFIVLGGALDRATGKAKSLAKLPGKRSCASNSLKVKLTKKARKSAKRVVVTVDGKRKAATGKPRKNRTLVLKKIGDTRSVEVEATVTTKKGTSSVDRSYVPCSPDAS